MKTYLLLHQIGKAKDLLDDHDQIPMDIGKKLNEFYMINNPSNNV